MARILVIDDQPEVVKMLEAILIQRGHTVATDRDAFGAMEKMKKEKFDLLITDAVMPGASGFELARTVRADKDHKDILILMLTGKRDKKDVEKGIQAGIDDYCVKPVDPDLFLTRVDGLLAKRSVAPVDFLECAIFEPAQFVLEMKITAVSEIGMTLQTSQPITQGSKIQIKSEFLDKLNAECPFLRVNTCTQVGQNFTIRTTYMGVGESFLQPLRVWIRANVQPSKAS